MIPIENEKYQLKNYGSTLKNVSGSCAEIELRDDFCG